MPVHNVVRAPEIDLPGVAWLNTDNPISLASLKGRAVILDFWTYCCVNCLHVIPVLHELEQRFGGRLTVIGIHSPKFTHEGDLEQVREAVRRYGVHHPVIHDCERQLWEHYAIKAWPTLVLVSTDGYVIGHYPGEPQFEALEAEIAQALSGVSPNEIRIPLTAHSDVGDANTGPFKYPAKIKRVPGSTAKWAVADTGHHQVVLLDDRGVELDRVGSGKSGFDDGTRATARFNGPEGLCCTEEAVFVADTRNHAVRSIDLESGQVSTIVGTGERGAPLPGYWNNSAHLSLASPWDLELVGDRLFIANAGTHQIIEMRVNEGHVRLAAGNGREGIHDGPAHQARLAQPSGLAYHPESHHLYFVDSETSSVRRLDLQNQWIDTLVGHGLFVFGHRGGSFEDARFQHPLGIAIGHGLIYVADSYNSAIRILDIAEHQVSDLEKDRYTCTDPLCAPLREPAGLSCVSESRLLVVDTNNHRILEYDLASNTNVTWSPPLSATGITQETGA